MISEIIQRIAGRIGATVRLEPEWGYVGQVTYASGVRRYFKLSTLDLNTTAASHIARDKAYANFFLREMGYPVADGKAFFAPAWGRQIHVQDRGLDAAWEYARALGLPVFVKPNSLSQGAAVARADTKTEFYRAAREAMRHDKVILVEQALSGRDYRLVVLDGKVISAYERIALSICGDGVSTITGLLEEKNRAFAAGGRPNCIDPANKPLLARLRKLRLTPDSVLQTGQTIKLLDNANLSTGGTSVDVTSDLHDGFRTLAARIAHDMGLRLVGVDLMVDGPVSRPPEAGKYWIIEINSAPGLDHYATLGEKQRQIVDDLYYQVIIAMERRNETILPPGA